MAKWFKNYSSIFLIVILGLSLRLIYLPEWSHFEMDEEVIAWKLRPFLQEGRPFLIGGGTPFGFHLGPAFYYLSAVPLWFSRLDPIGWGVAAAVLGAAAVFLIWIVGKTLYSRRVGLVAALLWATGFTTVMFDRHWWPLVFDPILSLLVMYFLFNILRIAAAAKGGLAMTGWIGLGLALAFGWQADLTVLPLFLATAVTAVTVWREQKKGIMAAVAILLVSVLPLVLFELRHPGQNLGKLFASEFLERSDPAAAGSDLLIKPLAEIITFIPQSLSRLIFPITGLGGNLLNFYTWCREIANARVAGQPWWAGAIATIILLTPFFSEKFAKLLNPADKILRLVILSGVVGILLFKLLGGNLYDFYLAVLYPVVILLAAKSIDFIWRKWGILAGGAIMLLIVGLNLTAVARAYHPQGLAVKQEAVGWIGGQLKGKDFELDSLSRCSRYNGVRYLFFLQDKEPAKSFTDNDLSWLYPNYNQQAEPEYLATFATPDDLDDVDRQRYNYLVSQAEARREFGDLEVIITKK